MRFRYRALLDAINAVKSVPGGAKKRPVIVPCGTVVGWLGCWMAWPQICSAGRPVRRFEFRHAPGLKVGA